MVPSRRTPARPDTPRLPQCRHWTTTQDGHTDLTRIEPKFMTMFAERRGFNLPEPALLVMDAHSVAEVIPADLFKLACRRLWAEFRYRRLPEPPDFTQAVSEEIAERREAAARVRSVALKIETAKMYEELDARS